MLRDDLRAFWTEPRPPDAPARVWRDGVLLGAGLCGVALEATLRTDVAWRPVAALLAWGNRRWTWAAAGLTLLGAVIVFLYQGVGGRIPNPIENPFLDGVWPLWSGKPVPPWSFHGRFEKTVIDLLAPGWIAAWPERTRWVAFVPLVAFQMLAIGLMTWFVREPSDQAAELRESRTSTSTG